MARIEDISRIFLNFHCPNCQSEFGEDSITIARDENDGVIVLQFKCKKCAKSFGMALLGLNDEDIQNSAGHAGNSMSAITYDDVLDAHYFIENFEKNWQKFIK